jgi:glycosyltransferase involved in cell wall biosynthesis
MVVNEGEAGFAPTSGSSGRAAIDSISVVFPCFNDAPTIGGLVDTARATLTRLGIPCNVIVVNDGSSDGSADVLAELEHRIPELHVVTHERNQGYGGAIRAGLASASNEWVFYTDGDGQYDPAELTLLVAQASDDVDVVQGYKLQRGDGPGRAMIGRTYHSMVTRMFALQVRDTDCDYRLIRRSVLERIDLRQTSGAFCVELLRKLQDTGARFTEVGVHHYPRPHGRSQFFRPAAIAGTLTDLFRLHRELRNAPATPSEIIASS